MKNVIHRKNEFVQHFTCEIFVHENSIWNVKMEDSRMKINFIREISIYEIVGEIFVTVGPLEQNKMTNWPINQPKILPTLLINKKILSEVLKQASKMTNRRRFNLPTKRLRNLHQTYLNKEAFI